MPIQRNRATARRSDRFIAAAAAALTPAVLSPALLAQSAGTDLGLSQATAPEPASRISTEIAKAAAMIQEGKLIQAKATVGRLMRSNEMQGATLDERTRAVDLLKTVDNRLQYADPFDVSLQKAEVALQDGDLQTAERHLKAVMSKQGADPLYRERASTLLKTIQQRREELAPVVKDAIQQAVTDFQNDRFDSAKSTLLAVGRLGLDLSSDDAKVLSQYQMRIVDLERANGRPFTTENVSLAMFQPGTIRRTDQPAKPSGEQPDRPINQPADNQPANPPPSNQPDNQPPPAPVSQPADDLIQRAMEADAQRVLSEADQAFHAAQYNTAVEKYSLVTTSYRRYLTADQVSHAEANLSESRVRLNQPTGLGPPIEAIELQRQRANAEFNNEITEAGAAVDSGDTARARDLSARARLTAGSNRGVFNNRENEDFTARVNELNRRIDAAEDQIRQAQNAEREKQLQTDLKQREGVRMTERERRINEAIDRARALQLEQKYDEALQVVDQILFLDPRNPAGLLLRDVITDIQVYMQDYEIRRRKSLNAAHARLEANAEMVNPVGIMDYPPDWPKKSFDRGEQSAFAETPENRRTLAALESQKIPVNFNDNTFADVVNFLKSITNLDIDADWDSLATVGVQKDTLVNLHIAQPLPVRAVLDRVVSRAGSDQFSKAGWAVTDGAVVLASDDALRKNRTMNIYDITDLLFEIPNYTEVPQIDLQGLLQQSQNGGGGGQSPFRDQQQSHTQTAEQITQRRQERIDKIKSIITSTIDEQGWADNGGETGTIQELNGSLIIRNTPKNHREITGLLSKLREIRSMQINVETKFLLVNQDWFEQIGFDIDLVLNANNNQVRAAKSVDPTIQAGDFFDFTGSNGGQRGLKRSVTGAAPITGSTGGTPPTTTTGVVNPRPTSPIGIFQDSLGLASSLAEGDFATKILGGSPALGIAGQFLDDVQVDFLIQATQADKRTVQLTAPRLTFTNGQTANIFVVTQQAFVSDLMPIVGDSAVGFDPTVAVASEGVTMLVEGVISSDRRYVTMNVDAGVGRIDGFAEQPVTAVAGGQLVNSAETQSFIQLPTITVTRVRTTVTVPDEGTVLLGGQRLVTELQIETGVPVLSKIPILNRFFTNRIESKEEQTLLILVKPTVLIQSEQEEKNFPGIGDSLMTGLR